LENGLQLKLAQKQLCTDNAGMIGALAERKLLRDVAPTSYDADILPGWSLDL
jgi:tRNA A37 threonylcarbamoyltransferase TsaD